MITKMTDEVHGSCNKCCFNDSRTSTCLTCEVETYYIQQDKPYNQDFSNNIGDKMSKQAMERAAQASKTVVIISAEDYRRNAIYNNDKTDALERTLNYEGYKYKKALGMYKGVSERSFVVIIDNQGQLSSIKWLAKDFRQESILIRAGNSIDLHYMNGDIEQLGTKFTQVSPAYAKQQDAYTIIGDCYYIVR